MTTPERPTWLPESWRWSVEFDVKLDTHKHMADKVFGPEPDDHRYVWWPHNNLKGWTYAREVVRLEDAKRAAPEDGP